MNIQIANKTIEEIALRILDIETLESRNMDRLDFHDLGVVSLKRALLAAYEAGTKENSNR